jgi:hypothetical protein
VTADEAEKRYGVVVRYSGKPDDLVKLAEHWTIDEGKTAALRKTVRQH